MIAWMVWRKRNQDRIDQRGEPVEKLLEQAQDFISEFQTASVKGHANDSNKKIPRSQVK